MAEVKKSVTGMSKKVVELALNRVRASQLAAQQMADEAQGTFMNDVAEVSTELGAPEGIPVSYSFNQRTGECTATWDDAAKPEAPAAVPSTARIPKVANPPKSFGRGKRKK